MERIVYFTAGAVATAPELAEIAAINTAIAAKYDCVVRRGDGVGSLDYGAGPEPADYVAGTPPAGFDTLPVFDPENPPA